MKPRILVFVQTDLLIIASEQGRLMAKGEEANKKEEMVKKLRSMIDLYTPPKDRQLRWQQSIKDQ